MTVAPRAFAHWHKRETQLHQLQHEQGRYAQVQPITKRELRRVPMGKNKQLTDLNNILQEV